MFYTYKTILIISMYVGSKDVPDVLETSSCRERFICINIAIHDFLLYN